MTKEEINEWFKAEMAKINARRERGCAEIEKGAMRSDVKFIAYFLTLALVFFLTTDNTTLILVNLISGGCLGISAIVHYVRMKRHQKALREIEG